MTRLSQWSNEFGDVAMERRIWRCCDGATIFVMTQFSRCRDEATNFAMSLWSDEYRDGAIELKIPRCHDEATIFGWSNGTPHFAMSRRNDGFCDVAMERRFS
jgi:hypothetical protein